MYITISLEYFLAIYHEFNVYIFLQVLGTPTEPAWPGINAHEEFLSYGFPYYERESLLNHAPRLDMDGLDLLGKLLCVSMHSADNGNPGENIVSNHENVLEFW